MKSKLRCAITTCLVFILILSYSQVFLFTSNGQSDTAAAEREYWLNMARNAWRYFQSEKGVNPYTGLHCSGLAWHYFTDWDLAVYLQATLDAERLGIISSSGIWGGDFRCDIILSFLETRELTSNNLPYWLYDSDTGKRANDQPGNACDAGKLFVALHNLQVQKPNLASRVNTIVYNRTNYEPFMHDWESLFSRLSIYDYYVTQGFAFFWPQQFTSLSETFLNNIVSAPTVETYGVALPIAGLSGEVLLHSMFELPPNTKLTNLARQVYLAHEARYNATGKFVAFSEGNTGLDNPTYVYECVVEPDGRTWIIKDTGNTIVTISPIIYLKVAVGFQAIYNTTFAKNMVNQIVSVYPDTANGYRDGIDESGRVVAPTIDKTNGIIIEAAKYAISLIPNSSPTPTSTPTPTPSPTSTSTNPTPTTSTTPTNGPTGSSLPSASPTEGSSPSAAPTGSSLPSASPTEGSSPTSTPTPTSTPINSEQEDSTMVVLIAVVGCLLLLSPFIILIIRRRISKT